MKLQFFADVSKIQNKAGTDELMLSVVTQEMNDDHAGQLIGLRNKHVNILVAYQEEIKDEDAEQVVDEFEVAPVLEDKSPSQRLRNVLYRQWESRYRIRYSDFDVFYTKRMEQIIEAEKDRI